jgi:hypothetical protein
MKSITCVCGLLLSVLGARAADFDLGARGILSLSVPDDWVVHGRPVPGINGPIIGYTFSIKPRGGAGAKCMLSFLYLTNGAPSQQTIRNDALHIGEVFLDGSVEKKETLHDFALDKGFGAYCLFTDATLVGKAPGPDEFKVMGIGEVQPADNMSATVSLMANDPDGPDFKTMVKIINSLKIKSKG